VRRSAWPSGSETCVLVQRARLTTIRASDQTRHRGPLGLRDEMNTVFYDAASSDRDRRQSLFDGELYVFGPRPSVLAFARFAQQMIEDAFGGLDPERAQFSMSVEKFAEILGVLKPKFIHHPESKRHLQAIFEDFGCEPEKTFFEVPKLRSSTSDGYLTAGIAYAWHPHRDTWYSAPACQVNWWMPVYELESDNAMAFHPRYWSQPVKNSSAGYNYYVWNQKYRGAHVTSFTTKDPRPLPAATEPVASSSSRARSCTRACRTLRARRATASIFGP
jgi:hypothetical protein